MVGWGSGGCESRIEVIVKPKKVGVMGGEGWSGGCEPRIEFILKLKKKLGEGGVGWIKLKNSGSGWWVPVGGQVGVGRGYECEPRIESIKVFYI